MDPTTSKASFRIIIVGAGIAGLCTGIGLAQQGHRVTILESAHELTPIGIGIHIPTNATLVLKHFGLLDRMRKDAINPTEFVFRRWEDSSVIARAPAPAVGGGEGLPYWSMRRSDYQRHLYEAAVEAGCEVCLSARVELLDEFEPSVTLAGGEVVGADLIVVANGVKSTLRNVVSEDDTSVDLNPLSSYRAYVNKADLLSDPITAPYFQEMITNIWTGYSRHVIVYPCGGDLYTIGATCPGGGAEAMEWTRAASTEQAQHDFRNFDAVVSRILHHSKDIKSWRLAEVPRLPRWTSKSGKVVLVGDAAHGMLQFLAQGAAMATEDGAALAECVARAVRVNEIPTATKAFERSRKWRCEIVQAQSRRNGYMIHMPDGEEQENRDRKLAGAVQTGLWDADTGPMLDVEFRKFLYEHNVIEHTRKTLDLLQL